MGVLEREQNAVKFELSTVNPVYVFEPQMFDEYVKEHLNTSCELINALVRNKPEAKQLEGLRGFYIDVRDVAKAHLGAFQKKEAVGQRLFLAHGPSVTKTWRISSMSISHKSEVRSSQEHQVLVRRFTVPSPVSTI